jgi:hypothetical protein
VGQEVKIPFLEIYLDGIQAAAGNNAKKKLTQHSVPSYEILQCDQVGSRLRCLVMREIAFVEIRENKMPRRRQCW